MDTEEKFSTTVTAAITPFPVQPHQLITNAMSNTNNNEYAQFVQRPKYNNLDNPMHVRRIQALQAIYQFLDEEELQSSLTTLEQESGVSYDRNASKNKNGILLESLDIRDAYFSAQKNTVSDNKKYEKILQKNSFHPSTNEACHELLFEFKNIHLSNILCVDIFYHQNIMYIITGTADRSLQILSCKNIKNSENEMQMKDRLIWDWKQLKSPPLYISIDAKYQRYAFVGCMDGNCYLFDLHSCLNNSNEEIEYQVMKVHKKYVIMVKWSMDSKYVLTASHDKKATLFKLIIDDTFALEIVHTYEFNGCVEAIHWTSNQPNIYEFVIALRNNNYLHYYRLNENGSDFVCDENCNYLLPFLKCNMNAFGDNHVSFAVGDMQLSGDGHFLMVKTDKEKVLLFVKGSEELMRSYFGSHSDLYSYTRCLFSTCDRFIYASHLNSFVVWDVCSTKILFRVEAHGKTLRDMVIDPVHGWLVTVSFDKTVKIWT